MTQTGQLDGRGRGGWPGWGGCAEAADHDPAVTPQVPVTRSRHFVRMESQVVDRNRFIRVIIRAEPRTLSESV